MRTDSEHCRKSQYVDRIHLFDTWCNECRTTLNYTDDTSHYLSGRNNQTIQNRIGWTDGKPTKINQGKTHLLYVWMRQCKTLDKKRTIGWHWAGKISEKQQGIIIHKYLNWMEHIWGTADGITGKINRKLGEYKICGVNIIVFSKLKLDNSLVLSIMQYGFYICGGSCGDNVERIQKVNNIAARWTLDQG